MKKSRGEWVVVTGAAKRLGATIALYLAQKGYSIVVHYNTSKNEAEEIVRRCEALGVEACAIQGDFTSLEEIDLFIKKTLQECPKIKFLINNVGNYFLKSALETSVMECIELFQTNLIAPFALIKGLIHAIKNQKGAIVNIGVSGIQSLKANTDRPCYNMTKQALLLLTKSLARELASSQVRVNMVSPGYLDMAVDLPKEVGSLPMGRAGSSEEVARVVAFLLENESGYITGQNIEVAGGVGL
jgi:NAD(P)-dependent dehydrogenase (short-subunit alcohol dehydrogenase family)